MTVADLDPSKSRLRIPEQTDYAPAGLNQSSARLQASQERFDTGRSRLAPWMPQQSMLETAKSWYAGANSQGTTNGWDSTFYRNTFAQIDQWQSKAREAGKGSVFYGWLDPKQNPNATGVATWGADPNDEAAKGAGDIRFGDVFNEGKKVGNVYDDYDKATADVLMGEFLFESQDKERWFRDPNRQSIMADEVEKARRENTDRALYSRSAESFDDNVRARERDIRDGFGDETILASGALGSAALGATAGAVVGSFVPVIGNIAGAVAGGLIGGTAGLVGTWLNQDQLVEISARAGEKADIANQTFNGDWLARQSMKIGEFSQVGQKVLSPFSNIVQGYQDRKYGSVGDMTSEFYEVDENGNRKRSMLSQGLDIAATLADGAMKWASPFGIWTDMALMGGYAAGSIGELSTGTVFNERRGQFDELEGWQEKSAAVANTGIDVVQMGVAGGFMKAARSARAAFTGSADVSKAAGATGVFAAADAAGPIAKGLDRAWAKLRGTEVTDRAVNTAGMRFLLDESGNVVSSRMTLEMLAPSEFLRWIPAGYQARRLARIDGGDLTRDHLLKASVDLTQNSMFRNAVLMGYSEGGEEFAQAWLEPMATGERGSWGEAFEAYLYGAAGGAGMGLGAAQRGPTTRQQMEARAYVQHTLRTKQVMTPEEWKEFTKGWKPADFERLARSDDDSNNGANDVLLSIVEQQRQDAAHGSSIGYAKMEAVSQKRFEELQKKALETGNNSLVLLGQTSDFRYLPDGTLEGNRFGPQAAVMSAKEAVNQVRLIAEGFAQQWNRAQQEVADARAAEQAETDVDRKAHLTDVRTAAEARLADLEMLARVSEQVSNKILGLYDQTTRQTDPQLWSSAIDTLNERLAMAYTGRWTDNDGNLLPADQQRLVRKSVELKLGRHPYQDRGSFSVMMPQVSEALTRANANGTVYMQQGMLKALGADHDGDTGIPLHSTYVDDDNIDRMRRGDQYMEAVEDSSGRRSYELVIDAPDSEWAFVEAFRDATLNPGSWSDLTVRAALQQLTDQIKAEFSRTTGGPLDAASLDTLTQTFIDSVIAGNKDARKTLVTDMMNLDYEGFRNHDNEFGVSSVQWLWWKISEQFDILQKDLAHVRASSYTNVPISEQAEAQETTIRSERARLDAATAGATVGLLTTDPVRSAQFLHYSALFRALTEIPEGPKGTMTSEQQIRLTELFRELGSGQTAKDIELITGRNAIEERVYYWLSMMANSVETSSTATEPELMMLLANMAVPSAELVAGTTNTYTVQDGNITMLQLLLKRSLDIEAAKHPAAEPDSDIAKKIKNLRRLTRRDPDPKKHSNTPSLALLEVFGNRALHELIGKDSAYISPQITLNQLVQMQRGLSQRERSDEIHRLKRQPAYLKDRGREFRDPPWPASVLSQGEINAYAMLVDTVQIAGDTYLPRLRERDNKVQERFLAGLKGLHEEMSAYRLKHSDRLSKGETQAERITILRDMLDNDPRLANDIAKLIPDAAALGVFQVHKDNRVTASAWLEQMLVEENLERAAAQYYFNIKLAGWNQKAGTVNLAELMRREDYDAEKVVELPDVRGRIDYYSLDSRFHQLMFRLASQADGIELMRFLKAMNEAGSIREQFDIINSEPGWQAGQAEMLPWHDEVSAFEMEPSDVWSGGSEASLLRENIRAWGQAMRVRGAVAVEAEANFEANKTLLHAMKQYADNPTQAAADSHNAKMYFGLLKMALENRRLFPDTQGQVVRSQLVELLQTGVPQTQNKGVADPMAAPFGESAITLDSFGYSDPVRQEMAAITAEDVDDVMTNLTKLVDGPVRIMLEDGSRLIFDITTPEKALDMLIDPMTQGLAQAILFPTVRDVNTSNVMQHYIDTDSKGSLAKMLKEATNKDLFQERSDFGEKLAQAHSYIGQLESFYRKQALERGIKDAEFYPLQQTIHDFITVYMHSIDSGRSPEKMRNQLFIDIAEAIKAIGSVEESNREMLKERIAAVMEARYIKDTSRLDKLLSDDATKALIDLKLMEKQFDAFQEALDDLDARYNAATTVAEQDQIMAEKRDFIEETKLLSGGHGYPHQTFLTAVSALDQFQMRGDSNDDYRRTAIIEFLGKNNRISKAEKKNNQSLYNRARRKIYSNPMGETIKDAEWNELASWAAEIYLRETTARGSSSIPIPASLSGEEANVTRRYHDQSFTYLLDNLFNPIILEGADLLSQKSAHYERRSTKEVAKMLTEGLLSDRRIGTWTEVIFNESMKARHILKSSPVGAAIQMEGSDPPELADYVGAGKVTWLRPEQGHFTTEELVGGRNQSLNELITSPMMTVKLHNHFVTSVMIESTDPNSPLDPDLADALMSVTSVNHTSAETIAAGEVVGQVTPSAAGALRVLDLNELNHRIEWLKSNGHLLGGFKVSIKVVDVDKKPHERRWANNIFFDGVGREAVGGSGFGAIASMFFGLNALNKIGQQNPLDMATKKGKGFRAWMRSRLEKAEQLEAGGASIAEVMAAKAQHLLEQEYPLGGLLHSDLPSLYKLMKMRHVVVGFKPGTREKEVWWAEKAIAMEQSGSPIPLDNWQLVPLSDSVAQTLWGRSGAKGVSGTPGSLVRPTFNIEDLDTFPDLSPRRLQELGLERLGDVRTDVANTRLAQVKPLPRATATFEKGKTYISLYKKRLLEWRGEAQSINKARGRQRSTGAGKFDIGQINQTNAQLITDMLVLEQQTLTNRRLGIPDQGIVDMAALQVSRQVVAQIQKMMESSNSMVWAYRHGLGSDQNTGVLGRADVASNFDKLGDTGPTFGDVVVLDLSDIINSSDVDDYSQANREATKVIKALSRKGMTVILTATRGHHDLRAAVEETLTSGGLGYRQMDGTTNIFVPITEDPEYNAAQRAINSTLLETDQYTTRNVAIRMVTDEVSTNLTEATEWIDPEHDRAYNTVSHTILPFRLTATDGYGRKGPFAYGKPQRGFGRANQLGRVNAKLQALLSTTEGREYLKELLGPENDYPKYVEHDNGMIEHGVLTLDDALDNLEKQVTAGKWALDKNETFYWGTIVPTVSGDGSIHLSRIGFKQPDRARLLKQSKLRFEDKELKFTATSDKLDDMQTLPPPTRVDEVRDDEKGFSVVGTYVPGRMAKIISEGIGLKTGLAPMPDGYRFPEPPIKSEHGAGTRVTRIVGSTSVIGKEARNGLINNFRDGFALTGIDFRYDMVDFIFGEDAGRSQEEKDALWDLAKSMLQEWSAQSPRFSGASLSRMLDNRATVLTMETRFNAIASSIAQVANKPFNGISLRTADPASQTVNSRIGTVLLATLAAPGIELKHVIGTAGISTVTTHEGDRLVRRLPALMTDALNDSAYPEVRRELIARMNRNMPRDPNNPSRLLQWFDEELRFHSIMTQEADGKVREEEITGFLQIHIPVAADENSLRLTYSGVSSRGKDTKHVADVTAEAVGGRLMPKKRSKAREKLPDALDELYGDNQIERFEDDTSDTAALYHMLTRIHANTAPYNPYNVHTPMEEQHFEEGSNKVRQYTYVGDRTKKTGWSKAQRIEGNRLATEFLSNLNITDPKMVNEVTYLVRQLFGIPGPAKDQKDYKERLTFEVFQTGVEYMKRNIAMGKNPLDGGVVPLPHEVFWKAVQAAQIGLAPAQQWLPLVSGNRQKQYAKADDWGTWVDALMGQVRASEGAFNSRFGTDLDGFFHTYQGTHADYLEMPTSLNAQIQAKLLDPETNRPYASIDPGRDAVLRDPIVLAAEHMTYDALVGKGAVTVELEAEEASDSVLSKRLAAMEAWQKGENLPKQKDLTVKEYAKQGAQYRESNRTTSNAMRNMVNASVFMRLFNPALYFSAMIEVPYRAALEGATNALTGQLTGRRGMAVAGVGQWLSEGLEKLELDPGLLTPRFSTNEISTINQLNKTMGSSTKFLGLVYSELAYQTVIGGGRGKIGEKLEMGAAAVARMTADPKWGMKSDALARRYNDAVWEYLIMTNSQITVEQYAHEMKLDPSWLEKRDPRAHAMGVNAVKQARGAKATMVGNGIMRPIDRMTGSENGFVNGAGHLIKIPFLFTRFNANMFMTMTGLSAMDQMAAMFFDGRQSNKLIESMKARAKLDQNSTATPQFWDNTDVIESIDLSRAFVRGAVTQTALMAMAMMAGGFSLDGEDEEERRRRRLATYLNTPYYHDPNKASNDWRWTDAIFLDNVPVLSNIFMNETGHAAVVPHWIIRQFTSPILGMMRFFETGNALEIVHGFRDSVSVMPTSVARLWREADMTAQLLMEAAEDDELLYEANEGASRFFVNMVMVYEKALFENAFINSLYQARDDFDRNPWAIPGTDGAGNILREEGTGNPVQTEALQPYQRETAEGEQSNRVGYATRKNRDALLHQYAEGNLSAAMVMSILPWVQGEQSSYLRGNMVTKKQRVEADLTEPERVEALIYSAYLGQGGQDTFTKEEIIGALKQREQAADRFWDQSEIEAEADEIYSRIHDAPLTIWQDGVEQMTLDGKEAVFRSLRDGVVGLDDPAIAGFHVLPEERDAIAERLTTALVQEGVDAGMSEQAAMYRMRRIWYGDGTDPGAPGLRELLYDKRIPSKPYIEYDQLNVTYVLGPDGKPWATPFTKTSILGAMGFPVPSKMAPVIEGVTSRDQRGNTIDLINGINTGQAALQPRPIQPEEIEIKDTAVKAAQSKSYTPGGGRRYGGGYGGGSSYGPPFQRMWNLPSGTSARNDGMPMINTSSPMIRRADTRRERISSTRGRLKQWQ